MTHAFAPASPVGLGGFRPRLLNLITSIDPLVEPVTLTQAKEWMRVDGTDQDDVITDLITDARVWAEEYTRRAFIDRNLDATFDRLPPVGADLYLPFPVVSILLSVSYDDTANLPNTIVIDTDVEVEPLFGLVRVLPDFSWPQDVRKTVWKYTAGYGSDADAVPGAVKRAILLAVAQMFELRIDQPVGAQVSKPQNKSSEGLLNAFRMMEA